MAKNDALQRLTKFPSQNIAVLRYSADAVCPLRYLNIDIVIGDKPQYTMPR